MSEEITRIEHTGFVSKSCSAEPRPYVLRRMQSAAAVPERKRPSQAAVYLFVRLGVCVLLFCAVLALKLANSETGARVLSLLNEQGGADSEDTSRLGRLRFVDVPSIIEVFAPSDGPELPVAAQSFSLAEDDTLLALCVSPGDTVRSPAGGTVLKTGEDPALGAFAAVSAGETDYYIYGLENIAVEQGQPLSKNSILGSTAGGELYLRVYHRGSPENPLEHFDAVGLG